jgi:hypothetical protein
MADTELPIVANAPDLDLAPVAPLSGSETAPDTVVRSEVASPAPEEPPAVPRAASPELPQAIPEEALAAEAEAISASLPAPELDPTPFSSSQPLATYKASCARLGINTNSKLVQLFDDTPLGATVDLSANYVGDRGVIAFAEALATCTMGVEAVSVRGNGVRNAGVTALAHALAQSGVKKLDISHNCISDGAVADIAALLDAVPGLQIEFGFNKFSAHARLRLADCVASQI